MNPNTAIYKTLHTKLTIE